MAETKIASSGLPVASPAEGERILSCCLIFGCPLKSHIASPVFLSPKGVSLHWLAKMSTWQSLPVLQDSCTCLDCQTEARMKVKSWSSTILQWFSKSPWPTQHILRNSLRAKAVAQIFYWAADNKPRGAVKYAVHVIATCDVKLHFPSEKKAHGNPRNFYRCAALVYLRTHRPVTAIRTVNAEFC